MTATGSTTESTATAVPVPGPACGHRRGPWTCERGQHPHAPRGHVYVSTTGSHVGAEEEDVD